MHAIIQEIVGRRNSVGEGFCSLENKGLIVKKVLYSPGGNDECLTPEYAVRPILKYIPKEWAVRCPFDRKDSNFVKLFTEGGWQVIPSHIAEGKDFFTYEPEHWDVIVSNPPFTNKRKFFERAIQLGKPFALIMSNTRLNDSAPKKIYKEAGIDMQLLMFDRRIEFIQEEGKVTGKTTFSSSYFCYNVLPKQIVIEYL